jgi:hypothetical protein
MASDILTISRRYFTRADVAFRARRKKNEENWRAYMGEQDFSYKADFQSRETTPGFPIAVEHIVGTFERALTDSDDWMTAEAPSPAGKPFLEPAIIQEMLQFYLERIWKPGNHAETAFGIQVLVGDACKRGIMEPYVIAKVWPVLVRKRLFRFERAQADADVYALPATELLGKQLKPVDVETLRIAVELIPYEDYFPDPAAACRYEIHRSRRALHELLANPEYDKEAVKRLIGQANDEYQKRNGAQRDADRNVGPDPYVVDVFEGWGDIIDHETGEILEMDGVHCENVFWAWAGSEVLRKPTPNPSWDGTRPFVVAPMIRVPGTVEGKALADHAVPMWKAINELVNLLLDSAMKAAWGVGQVRPDLMESPEEIADGVPQGYTAVLKPNTPQGVKFYERVDNGEAPQISLDNLNRLEGYLQQSLAMPDTKMGTLPQRQTKATEVVQAMQSAGSLYESFAARFEDTFLEPLFEKCWRLLIQYSDDFMEEELVQILGPTNVIRLQDMSPAERFQLVGKATFRVRGLRGVASKERTFQKLMTVVNLLSSNQQFADNFGQTKDFTKLWEQLLRATGIDPTSLDVDEEPDMAPEEMAPEQGMVAGGQLDPALAPSSGASQPNVGDTAQAGAGGDTTMAPNNPAGNQAVS